MSGPTVIKGIPVYAPNRLPVYRGVYALGADLGTEAEQGSVEEAAAQARRLTVLYTRQDLFIPQNWISRRCGSWRLYQVPGYETFSLCYRDEGGFFLYFLFPDAEEPGDWCAFTAPFIERFLFLYNFVNQEKDVPFPAILEIRTR
ncbi:MAG: hypothetical protein JSV89_10135 [Spirochaetaceae bacterium]|nr:MAG: hypothetical protein JSV89_10135 [Spirochaetaceae bacterium]